MSDIILFLFEILGPTRTSEFRKRHFDSPDYGRNGPNSDDESHYGGFLKTQVYAPEETLRLPSISKIDLSVIQGDGAEEGGLKQALSFHKLIKKTLEGMAAKINSQAPHRVLAKELSDLDEMITSSFDLILTQMKQLEKATKANEPIIAGHRNSLPLIRDLQSHSNSTDQVSSLLQIERYT